ncbi:MAG: hypothetical protein WCX85_00515 [Bacilli bacterium]|jgi:hypothetical protein
MKRKTLINIVMLAILAASCHPSDTSTSNTSNGELPLWNGESIVYSAENISQFGSATPSGVANYDEENNQAVIWNTDASLDNYGGVQTPMLSLDFSKAVIFEMDVISCYSQYVIKLAVEGVNETFYVLADDGSTGLISVNVVDSMLSDKFSTRRTSPDPGYENGWLYDNMTKRCSFHVLAKGPDGERQTAELVLGHLAIYNNMAAVTRVEVTGSGLSGGVIAKLKGSQSITLNASVLPATIEDQSIIWSSEYPEIASVSEIGVLSFINVGRTYVTAKSKIDQSKYQEILVDVLSGYENPDSLKIELTTLTYGGSSLDTTKFNDLYETTWGSNIFQITTSENMVAVDDHLYQNTRVFENYFNSSNSTHVSEAQSHQNGSVSAFNLYLSGVSNATIYRMIEGKLYQESYNSAAKVKYASYDTVWSFASRYVEKTIVVTSSGSAYKYELDVIPASLIGNYYPSDFFNQNEWIIPDRTKASEDRIAHALSPAALRVSGDIVYLKQNKYPEAKYCFGGIVSKNFVIESEQDMTMLLDVASLNQKNDYVKTMWEVKIIYYAEDDETVINTNPLKVMSGNTIGQHELTFTPAYRHFRIYLVVNGSDIGEQFADAEMGIHSFKMYALR